jgi:hypothetical protein
VLRDLRAGFKRLDALPLAASARATRRARRRGLKEHNLINRMMILILERSRFG